MATLTERPSGIWEHRRRVPDRLRKTLGITEVRRSLETKDKAVARQRLPALIAEIDRLFASAGQVVTLDHRRIVALAAEWLAARVAQDEVSPPDADTIDLHLSALQDTQEGYGKGITASMSSTVDDALASKGLVNVDEESRKRLALQLFTQSVIYWQTLSRRLNSDYGPVPGIADAPKWVAPVIAGVDDPSSDSGVVSLLALFDAWAKERKPRQKTVDSWRGAIGRFVAFIGHDDAKRVTPDDVVRWKDAMVKAGLTATTINNTPLIALRSALGYGKANRRLPDNAAMGVRALVARDSKVKMLGYSDEQARVVLGAARKLTGWRRWLPVLCAYTGARVSEPADAMAADVKVSPDGVWYLDLRERTLKNESSARMIPLHPALIEEGFIDYVRSLKGDGPLFPDCIPAKTYDKRGHTASKEISKWVRNDLKITDTRLAPNHAWRHRMATLHRMAKIPRDASRYLRGYSPEDDSDDYGTHSLTTLAAYVALLPAQG